MLYAIRCGRQCGVFSNLEELEASIVAFKGAEFRGFETLRDADVYLTTYADAYDGIFAEVPPAPQHRITMQFYHYKKDISSVACTGCTLRRVANSEVMTAEMMEATSVLDVVKNVPDDGQARWVFKIGTHSASTTEDDGSLKYQSLDELIFRRRRNMPTCYILRAIMSVQNHANSCPDSNDAKAYDMVRAIVDANARRKIPVMFESSDDICHLYHVRVPMFVAYAGAQAVANTQKKEEHKD